MFNLALLTITKDKGNIKSRDNKVCYKASSTCRERDGKTFQHYVWMTCSCNDSPMTNMAMQEKALSTYEDLVTLGNVSGAAAPSPFTTTKGWLERFKNRNNLHSVTQSGEAAQTDKRFAQAYLPVLKKIIRDEGYTAQQVINIDEIGLYWKQMPKKTVISMEEKKAPGNEASSDSVTAGWW